MVRHEARVDLALRLNHTDIRSNMSKQTFVMPTKNYPRPLAVFGEHAAMPVSGEAAIGSELFLKEGSGDSTSPRHRRPSGLAASKTFKR